MENVRAMTFGDLTILIEHVGFWIYVWIRNFGFEGTILVMKIRRGLEIEVFTALYRYRILQS